MKSISRITRRVMLVFLALVASSTMFFSSPAVAATSSLTFLTPDNFETEVADSDKYVIVILVPEHILQDYPSYLEDTKAEAEKFYGDKYKIVVGKAEENREIYGNIFREEGMTEPRPAVVGFTSDYLMDGFSSRQGEIDLTDQFKYLKKVLEESGFSVKKLKKSSQQ